MTCPKPPAGKKRRPWVRRAGLGIFAAIGLVALVQPYLPRLAGGIVLILVLSSMARPRLSPRAHATLTGLTLAGWSLAMIGTSKPDPDPRAFIAMFAVIVAMLTLFAVLHVINRPDYERFGNGYDVRIQSTGSIAVRRPAAGQADITRSVTLPTRGYFGPVTGGDVS